LERAAWSRTNGLANHFAGSPLFLKMTATAESTVEMRGLDGVPRLYAFSVSGTELNPAYL
jgi:hypothetical protein